MLNQVYRFKDCLDQGEPWTALTGLHPELERTSWELSQHAGVDHDHIRQKYLAMLQTYVDEWQSLSQFPHR